MLTSPLSLQRHGKLKRSKSRQPRIEWMEARTLLTVPAVTGLNPATGTEAGGTPVTVSGTGFTGATIVDFGTQAATNLNVLSDTSIEVDSPAGSGTVDVTVTNPSGTSPTSSADQFTYTAVTAPAVTSLSPTSGTAAGGTPVTITGTGFTGATVVDFGTTPATDLNVLNDTSITVDSPAGTGTVDVTVTTPAGTSPTTSADQFTYTAVTSAPRGHQLEPHQWYGGRRHSRDDHRHRALRQRHYRRLRHDGQQQI